MVTNLCKLGSDLALLIEPLLLTQLQIDETTLLELSVNGNALFVTPVRDDERKKRFEEALADTNSRFANTLKRLAE